MDRGLAAVSGPAQAVESGRDRVEAMVLARVEAQEADAIAVSAGVFSAWAAV